MEYSKGISFCQTRLDLYYLTMQIKTNSKDDEFTVK